MRTTTKRLKWSSKSFKSHRPLHASFLPTHISSAISTDFLLYEQQWALFAGESFVLRWYGLRTMVGFLFLSTALGDNTSLFFTLSGERKLLLVSSPIQLSVRLMTTSDSEHRNLWRCTVTFFDAALDREIGSLIPSPEREQFFQQRIRFVAGPLPSSWPTTSSESLPNG